ncbi:MAG: methylaspartate mutase subunit E [Clostridia bacterium]
MEINNRKWTMDKFTQVRQDVLRQWPTGKEVNIEESIKYHLTIPESKNFSKQLSYAKHDGRTLIQPRAGVALPTQHIELLQFLEKFGGADLLPTTIDSYTRLNRYQEAEVGIRESITQGRSLLNGFPAVNHGVNVCRSVTESVGVPVQVRHGTPDARLLAEITLAGGFTSYEGGGISYNIPYSKNHSLEQTIYDWQYTDRLVGLYEENGVQINREPFGPLTGTLVSPCISHSVAIIESLLAAEQGVKNITVGYGQCGNLIQDVAAIRSLEMLTNEYLLKFGFTDVEVTTVIHQWMGGFPNDEAKAFGVIAWGAAIAGLSGATKVIVKSPQEAMGIPTKEANAQGLRTTKQVIKMISDQFLPTPAVRSEIALICEETRCIMDRVIELGVGDVAVGAIRGFEAGIIDVPFAPSKYNNGKALPARDNDGAVRFFEFGNLPFTDEIKNFHTKKMAKRAQFEGREVSFQMVIDDIYAVSEGNLVGRPKEKR